MTPPARRMAIVVHALVPGDPRVQRQSDALLAAGWQVDVFALRDRGEPAESVDGALRVFRMPVGRWFTGFAGHIAEYVAFTAIAGVRLAREHRRQRYRLVQVATVPDFLAFAALPEKLSGVPLLLDLHEDMPEFFRDRFGSPLLRPLVPVVSAVSRASAGVADALITVHEPLRRLSIERGVPPERISVVMNSADERIFDPARHPRHAFMADGRLRLIHHSNLQRIYGLDVAVEAMALLRGRVNARLEVYGDGPYRGEIEATMRRTATSDSVTLHGRAPIEDIPALIAGADIGLVPSLPEPYMRYSLSTKLLEYAAMGLPTIASDLATFRHHFDEGALRYVPGGDPLALADAIAELAADPDAAAALGAEAQRQARAYAWSEQRATYLDLIDSLAGRATL